MSEETIEKIFETACDLCHWPYVYRNEGTLQAEKCDYCPMEEVLKEAAAEADELEMELHNDLR